MKNIVLLILLFHFFSVKSQNIKDNGIYKTKEDFISGILTDDFNKCHHCVVNDLSNRYVRVQKDGIKTKYKTSDIWGFRKNGFDYRIYNKEYFRIDVKEGIFIYTLQGYYASDIPMVVESHYFSKNIDAPIIELTRNKMKKEYCNDSIITNKLNKLPKKIAIDRKYSDCNCYYITEWFNQNK